MNKNAIRSIFTICILSSKYAIQSVYKLVQPFIQDKKHK